MTKLILIIKGFLIGIGKIIPGVSGSLLAISLHVYNEAITAINDLKTNPIKSISYLVPMGIGMMFAILLFSRLILFFLTRYYVLTMFFFIGLIAGSIPSLRKNVCLNKKVYKISFLLAFFLPFFLSIFSNSYQFLPTGNLMDFLILFLMGFLDATTMIIPGISGTATFMMMGWYNYYLFLFSNPFQNIFYTFLFGMGLLLGIFLISRFVAFGFSKHPDFFYTIIYGLLFNALVYLIGNVLLYVTLGLIFPSFMMFFLGFCIVLLFDH